MKESGEFSKRTEKETATKEKVSVEQSAKRLQVELEKYNNNGSEYGGEEGSTQRRSSASEKSARKRKSFLKKKRRKRRKHIKQQQQGEEEDEEEVGREIEKIIHGVKNEKKLKTKKRTRTGGLRDESNYVIITTTNITPTNAAAVAAARSPTAIENNCKQLLK